RGLPQPMAVEIDRAAVVLAAEGIEPIAVEQVAIWVEVAEKRVGQGHGPGVVLQPDPTRDDLRAFYLGLLARRCLIDDALCLRAATAGRVDPLAVDARVHRDDVARLGNARGFRNGFEGGPRRAVRVGWAAGRDVVFHACLGFLYAL